ncbi:MAG: H-type lectin domain-containing protein [Magnetococcales bacterium]|nr:H-type lectin domain-containing protein [Magnetococcales bacterium]
MRPIVIVVFFLIFSAATLVWIMNDPEMRSWKNAPVLSTIAKYSGQTSTELPIPSPLSSARESAGQQAGVADEAIFQQLSLLQSHLARLEGTANQTAQRDGGRLEALELALTQQKAEIKAQKEKMERLKQGEAIRLDGGTLKVEKGDRNWKLSNMFSKKRVLEQKITFSTPFLSAPKVVLGLSTIELLTEKIRLSALPLSIEPTGFTLQLETKSDAKAGDVSVDWVAFGQ